MTRRSARAPARALCLGAALVCFECRTGVKVRPEEFAVEGPPGHYVTIATGLSTETPAALLKPLSGRATTSIHLDTLKLDYRTEGDTVIATVYALSAPKEDPHRYDDSYKHLLGVHSARLNQTFDLKELEKIGYQAVTYKIVAAKPPVPTHPTLISRVPSIQIELAGEDRASYRLAFRNASDRDVMAYAFGDDHSTRSHESYDVNRPVIAARAIHEEPFVDVRSPIFLLAAIFSDGSHEGDPEVAATLYARRVGLETQRRLADPLIRRILGDDALDDTAKIVRIRSELTRLSNKPNAPMIRAMRVAFPNIPAETVQTDLVQGLDVGVHAIWSSLYEFEHQNSVYPRPKSHPPLAEWWPTESSTRATQEPARR